MRERERKSTNDDYDQAGRNFHKTGWERNKPSLTLRMDDDGERLHELHVHEGKIFVEKHWDGVDACRTTVLA